MRGNPTSIIGEDLSIGVVCGAIVPYDPLRHTPQAMRGLRFPFAYLSACNTHTHTSSPNVQCVASMMEHSIISPLGGAGW